MGGRAHGVQGKVVLAAMLALLLLGACAGQALAAHTRASERAGVAKGLGYSLTPSKTEPYAVCPPAIKGRAQCMAIAVPGRAEVESEEAKYLFEQGPEPAFIPDFEGSGEEGGFSPSDLRSAYKLPETGGSGQTVAIVDAYDDPNAEADLNVYRKHYKVLYKGLEECTKANGCFKKINQKGEEKNYPKEPGPFDDWTVEMSLDMDMVSAVCSECRIVLVEAENEVENAEKTVNLYDAEEAASKWEVEEGGKKWKTTEISNSWGSIEESGETEDDKKYFEHEGIVTTVSGGDDGYGVSYPAASPHVVSVGGTALVKSSGTRGWSEEAWVGTGGGCGVYEEKPKWQEKLKGCSHRVDNDVSAVAAPETPVSIYDSFERSKGWLVVGGTSVSSPFMAGVEALSSSTFRSEGPEAFYKDPQGSLFDVALGSNGFDNFCAPPSEDEYLCNAELGYDGPTGNGTPDFDLGGASSVVTGPVTNVKLHEAKLTGTVNPKGVETHYHFEYGPTTSYGTSIPVPEASVGSGTTNQPVSQSLTGLSLETTYHYRLVATSGAGTIYGEDHTFATVFWSATHTRNVTDAEYVSLNGVSCSSSTACTAVGTYSYEPEYGEFYDFAERWNGTEWSIQSTPNLKEGTDPLSELTGVSCSSATSCTAVGYSEVSREDKTVVSYAEHWNGSEWLPPQVVPKPVESGVESNFVLLHGVSCSSSTVCTAVGVYANKAGYGRPLAERLSEGTWSLQKTYINTPNEAEENGLSSVSCASTTVCVAAGEQLNEQKSSSPLVESWTSSTGWALDATPSPSKVSTSWLAGISCVSVTECVAVGSDYPEFGSGSLPYFAERLTGGVWSLQSMPAPKFEGSELFDVSCSSPTACTAVGRDRGEGKFEYEAQPFGLRWNGTEWSIQETSQAGRRYGRAVGVSCASSGACVAVGRYAPNGFYAALAENYAGPPAPVATTEGVSGVSTGGSTLEGSVNPEGDDTHYYFEYGKTTSYGTSVPVQPGADAGSGESNTKVSETIGGLESEITYHYRLVAINATGTITYGADRDFLSTATEWGQGGMSLSEAVATKSKGTFKVTAEGEAGAKYKIEVECEDSGEGSVDPGVGDEETKWTTSKCAPVSGGKCEAGRAEVIAMDLPWHSELVFSEGTSRDVMTSGGKGTPGYTIKCIIGGIFKVASECTGTIETAMTNVTGGVDATFDGENLGCTNEKSSMATIEGTQLIEASKGSKLEVTT
jgi:hypothetical protein